MTTTTQGIIFDYFMSIEEADAIVEFNNNCDKTRRCHIPLTRQAEVTDFEVK